MLNESPRKNPTSVWPLSRANSTARLDGAETAQTTGIRAASAFCMISNDARPLTRSACRSNGSWRPRNPQPRTLSTALCRPTSSRRTTSLPRRLKIAAACKPPGSTTLRQTLARELRSRHAFLYSNQTGVTTNPIVNYLLRSGMTGLSCGDGLAAGCFAFDRCRDRGTFPLGAVSPAQIQPGTGHALRLRVAGRTRLEKLNPFPRAQGRASANRRQIPVT